MALIKWIRVSPLKNLSAIKQLESAYGFTLSEGLLQCILSNNGGRPRPNTILLKNGEENDVKALLSYNREDTENIYKVIEYFAKNYTGSLIPFAIDSAGNYYCEQGRRIVLWTQNKEILPICNSFACFLDSLYDLE